MSHSSPEGIVLGKGSKLVSAELSINKEKVFSIKQEKLYTEEDLLDLLMFIEVPKDNSHIKEIKSVLKEWLEKIKNK